MKCVMLQPATPTRIAANVTHMRSPPAGEVWRGHPTRLRPVSSCNRGKEEHMIPRTCVAFVLLSVIGSAQAQTVDRVAAAAVEERICKNAMLGNPQMYIQITQGLGVSM